MSDALDWHAVAGAAIALLSVVTSSLMGVVYSSFNAKHNKLQEQTDKMSESLANFRIEVARDYPTEEKIFLRLQQLKADMDASFDDVLARLAELAAQLQYVERRSNGHTSQESTPTDQFYADGMKRVAERRRGKPTDK